MMTSTDDLAVERDGYVAVLTMRRAPANYFDPELLASLVEAAQTAVDDGCRALVLCSEGRHFSAGANFLEVPSGAAREEFARVLYAQAARLFDIEVPIVAAVQGAAIGGGLGLACAADFRVVGPRSRLQANFARLGFHQGFGLSATLPRLVGDQVALELLYTGRALSGREAVEAGLADRLAPEGGERLAALAWAHEIAESAPLAVRSMKRTMRESLAAEVDRLLERELAEQARLWRTEDCQVGIAASLERSDPVFHGR